MPNEVSSKRVDAASIKINAAPPSIYRAFLDADAVASWLPPEGMTGRVEAFEPRENGIFRMTLTYDRPDHSTAGKTSEHSDTVVGRFVQLIPNSRIVQSIEFESEDPAFAGTMNMTWTMQPIAGGTEVTVRCEDVPDGIRQEDHLVGLHASLANLAAFTEKPA